MTVLCPYCDHEPEMVTGDVLYPHRPDLSHKRFLLCRPCHAYVGMHADGRPLGTPAREPLRRSRSQVHAALDPLWLGAKDRRTKRREVYARLAAALGIPVDDCHVGYFDSHRCADVIAVLRAWSTEESTNAS